MKNTILASLLAAGMIATPLALGQEEENVCLDCHEPAEDWEGMSAEEIFIEARDPDKENKRHRDNDALSDEQLKVLISTMTE